MNTRSDLEHFVADWLREEAPPRARPDLLKLTLARVADTPQVRVLWRRAAPGTRRASRPLLAFAATTVALSLLGALAIVGGRPPEPSPEPSPALEDGWVAFTTAGELYVVRPGQVARPIQGTGSEPNEVSDQEVPPPSTQACPAFSPDGTRLAYGEADVSGTVAYPSASLVIADLDELGDVYDVVRIRIGISLAAPCAAWSPDGRRLAFAARPSEARQSGSAGADLDLRIVSVEDGEVSIIPDISVLDLDWSPDGSRLAVVNGQWNTAASPGPIRLYSAQGTELETLPGTVGARSVSWSPDGSRIAYQRGDDPAEIVVRELASGDEQVIASGLSIGHGVGPVWSPTGDRIAYQRLCDVRPDGLGPCREEHEVAVITAGSGASWRASDVSEVVLPLVSVADEEGDSWWLPFRVTWSPDGESLLYLAWGERVTPEREPAGHALISVPIDAGSQPVMLALSDELPIYHDDVLVATQMWGRRPVAEAVRTRPLEPGPHRIEHATWSRLSQQVEASQPGHPYAQFTVPEGWTTDDRGRIFKHGGTAPTGMGMQIGTVTGVYADPCHWLQGLSDADIRHGPSQPGFTERAAALTGHGVVPESTSLAGVGAHKLILATPVSIDHCDLGEFRRWIAAPGRPRFEHRAGQTDLLWLLDPDREMIAVQAWYFEGTTDADRAELQAIVQSMSLP